jgi:hypothetical protein
MVKLLRRHVLPELAARRFAWGAAFVLGAACTALVLKMVPELGVWASIGLVYAVALAWVVLGTQLPRLLIRAEPDAAADRPRDYGSTESAARPA